MRGNVQHGSPASTIAYRPASPFTRSAMAGSHAQWPPRLALNQTQRPAEPTQLHAVSAWIDAMARSDVLKRDQRHGPADANLIRKTASSPISTARTPSPETRKTTHSHALANHSVAAERMCTSSDLIVD